MTIERLDRALGHLAPIIELHGDGSLPIFERLLKERAAMMDRTELLTEVARFANQSKP